MIRTTWRASFSYMLRHPWQLALSLLGISIGVAVIVAVDLANSSARKAFLLSMDAITGQATHQVVGGPRGVAESTYVDLRTIAGFEGIAPVVTGSVSVDDVDLELLGIDLFAEQEIRAFTQLSSDGESTPESLFRDFLLRPGSATMSEGTAAELQLAVGDTFTVESAGKIFAGRLVGVFPESESTALDRLVTVDIATALEWLGLTGRLSRIDVRIEDGDDSSLERLLAALPGSARVFEAQGRTRTTADLSAAFMTNLTAMSLLALLVGVFLIYNSVSFSVLQRRKLIGVLRALGVTRRQVLGLIIGEAAVLGTLAATLGVALGVVLGEELLSLVARSINDLYFRVSVTSVIVDPSSIVKGLVAGIGASLAAAAVPATEATGYQPRLAMTRSTLEAGTRSLLPAVALGGLAIMLLAVVVLVGSGRNLVAGLTAVFMLILGFALCIPLLVKFVSLAAGPLAGRIGRSAARMAVAGVAASLSRTGVAIVALAVAVSATIGVSVMVDSFRGSVSSWLDQTLQADIYTGVRRGTFDPLLLSDITSQPGIEAFSTSRRVRIEGNDGETQIHALEMAPGAYAGAELIDADPADVWPAWESGDAILVSQPYAYQQRKQVGDSVRLRTDSGEMDFRVLATYRSYDTSGSAVLMSRSTYDRHYRDDGIDSIGLYLADGVDPDTMIETIRQLSAGRQALMLNSNAKIRELSLEIFDQTFVITDVLYWLALGVALIGILSSMLALQLENGREQGLLRALGMTPLQVGGMITTQTGFIGVLSGLASIPLGVVMAYVLIEVINRRAFGWQIDMVVAPGILISAVLFAFVSALIAGIYPAWRAGRTQPALAMRQE